MGEYAGQEEAVVDVRDLRCRVAAKRGLVSVPPLYEVLPEARLAMLIQRWAGVLNLLAPVD